MRLLAGMTVLAAIQFDGEVRFFTEKIEIVIANRMLAAKFITAETPVPQPAPQKFFGPGFLFPKLASTFCHKEIMRHRRCGFQDASLWEKTRKRGSVAIKRLIDEGLRGTSVTCVLIGQRTASRKYVTYEIEQSVKKGNGLLGIHINGLATSRAIPTSGGVKFQPHLPGTGHPFTIGIETPLATGLKRRTNGQTKGLRKIFWKSLLGCSDK